ncbi:MAG: DUF1611 domain-containing protein [SAR324 cluster bacterium]|nr:DUF1611 domain-containing protein [SAR324 cluster bacterium]
MDIKKQTAIVYCDKEFGLVDGKTAAGLIRHSELYDIIGVIDSLLGGQDAGEALGEKRNGIPIFTNLEEALGGIAEVPLCYIYGKAPLDIDICNAERVLVIEAMAKGMNIISGLHQFFSEDAEFVAASVEHQVTITDIRKPPQIQKLCVFTGKIAEVTVPVVAVLGTDCACGKMTTAVELNKAFNQIGVKSVLVATGQTALMQGAKYGRSIDALVSQFVIGEIEDSVLQAVEHENPDIILMEGQGAVGHPAFMSSTAILKGSLPGGVVLQHAPARKVRCDFPQLPMPTLESEIKLIEAVSKAKVMAITINHEDLSDSEMLKSIKDYEQRLGLPALDVLIHGCDKLIQALGNNFPTLGNKLRELKFAKVPA